MLEYIDRWVYRNNDAEGDSFYLDEYREMQHCSMLDATLFTTEEMKQIEKKVEQAYPGWWAEVRLSIRLW